VAAATAETATDDVELELPVAIIFPVLAVGLAELGTMDVAFGIVETFGATKYPTLNQIGIMRQKL
jgi:hypothetical protein